jgi:hypothetical protein
MTLSNKLYDLLKPIALVWLPAIGTLYFALSQIWGLPDGAEIVGSITAADTFLGGILHISSSSLPDNDGSLVIDKSDPSKDTYSLEPSISFDEIDKKDTITFKVVQKTGS